MLQEGNRARPNLNMFQGLFPSPDEDDYTNMLLYVVHNDRFGGPEALKAILETLQMQRLKYDNYKIATQERFEKVGRFDLRITSPDYMAIIENKVDEDFDARSQKSVERYWRFLEGQGESEKHLLLNTKYPVTRTVPNYVERLGWHRIAKALDRHVRTDSVGRRDLVARDFLDYLERKGMGVLKPITGRDAVSFGSYGNTVSKFDEILTSVTSEAIGVSGPAKKESAWKETEPYYGKRIPVRGLRYCYKWLGFWSVAFEEEERRQLRFTVQLFVKDEKFGKYLEDAEKESKILARQARAKFYRDFYWVRYMDVEKERFRDYEGQLRVLTEFVKQTMELYDKILIPGVKRLRKQYDRLRQ
jgi:hypothetical protein